MKVKVIVFVTAILFCMAKGVSQNGTGLMQLDSVVVQNNSKIVISYDIIGNCILLYTYILDNVTYDWKDHMKQEYTYDDNANRTEIGYYRDTNDWRISYKCEYTYNNNGNQTRYNEYGWDKVTYNWKDSRKREYTYDDNGNLIMCIQYKWNINDWINDRKQEYNYDNNGNQTIYIVYNWDNAANDYIKYYKSEYMYDLSYSKTDLIFPSFTLDNMNNMLKETKQHMWNGTDWDNRGVVTYYWSSREITGISEAKEIQSNIKVYPNPTKGELRIENGEMICGEIEILDVVGRVVFRSQETTIDISHLSAGIYFLRTAGKTVKIIKE